MISTSRRPMRGHGSGAQRASLASAPLREEGAEQLSTLAGKKAAGHLRAVIQARLPGNVEHASAGSGLWVAGAEDHARNPREDDGARTHRARLERVVDDRV